MWLSSRIATRRSPTGSWTAASELQPRSSEAVSGRGCLGNAHIGLLRRFGKDVSLVIADLRDRALHPRLVPPDHRHDRIAAVVAHPDAVAAVQHDPNFRGGRRRAPGTRRRACGSRAGNGPPRSGPCRARRRCARGSCARPRPARRPPHRPRCSLRPRVIPALRARTGRPFALFPFPLLAVERTTPFVNGCTPGERGARCRSCMRSRTVSSGGIVPYLPFDQASMQAMSPPKRSSERHIWPGAQRLVRARTKLDGRRIGW